MNPWAESSKPLETCLLTSPEKWKNKTKRQRFTAAKLPAEAQEAWRESTTYPAYDDGAQS